MNAHRNPNISFYGSFITSGIVGDSAVDFVDLQRIQVFEIKPENGLSVTGWSQPPFTPKQHQY